MPNDAALPANVQVEATVLGAMILSADAINDALEYLTAADFLLDSHQRIFTAISEMTETGNPVDFVILLEEFARRKWLDAIGGQAYLAFLTEGIPRNPNIQSYIRIVKDKSTLRQLLSICNDGMARASDQSETSVEVMAELEERILELSQQQHAQPFTTLVDAIKEVGSVDDYMAKMCDPAELTGLPTGFVDVDKVWGGMQQATLIIVAARPGMGKSAWLFNLSTNVVTADADAVIALFSLEMSKEAFFKRIVASVAGVSSRRAQEGFISQAEKARMASAVMRLGGYQIHIDDTAEITPLQMRAKARRLKQRLGRLDLVGIDYIQLVKASGKHGNRQEEVSSVSRSLKAMSKELKCPVVALAQLSRKNEERGDKRPMLSDLRESGSLEQDSDVVAFIHRPDYYASEDDPNVERGIAEFITAKNREGQTGTRKLSYVGEYTRFGNLEIQRSTANAY